MGEQTSLNLELGPVQNMILLLSPLFFPLIMLSIQEDPGFLLKLPPFPKQYTPQEANKKMEASGLW